MVAAIEERRPDAAPVGSHGFGLDPGLMDCALFEDRRRIAAMARELQAARPYPHIVIDGLFDRALLAAVAEEIAASVAAMPKVGGRDMAIRRAQVAPTFGSATFALGCLLNANAFVRFLSELTGIGDLVVDHSFEGAGAQGSEAGGFFNFHRDFMYHRSNLLKHSVTVIVYLNSGWEPAEGGTLELWDVGAGKATARVEPVFGRMLVFVQQEGSFHGHPDPFKGLSDPYRKLFLSRYYTNDHPNPDAVYLSSSLFLSNLAEGGTLATEGGQPTGRALFWRAASGKARAWAMLREVTPPVVFRWADKALRKVRGLG